MWSRHTSISLYIASCSLGLIGRTMGRVPLYSKLHSPFSYSLKCPCSFSPYRY